MSQTTEGQPSYPNELFPVVGIGASAGGLEAFTDLLRHLPTDTGMAFVLIQHMAPDRRSMLTEILSRASRMPVTEVQDSMAVEPDHIYVIPPNTEMTLVQGVLQLTPREPTWRKFHPVNTFFRSLAADRDSKAIGIVLSGTDGDGALGMEAIKQAGGVTFAQCEATAKFDGMPNTAVATGHVDFVLPPQEIAEELAKISRHPYVTSLVPDPSVGEHPASPPQAFFESSASDEEAFSALLVLLRMTTGVDFTQYKQATVQRRLKRRMVLYHLERLVDYVQYLHDHPAEVQALYQDILITVTSFFRDPEAFAVLKGTVFPRIVQGKSAESPIRIWVPGCATGQEVYSIAICLLEFLAEQAIKLPIQLFGTDISEAAIETARAGIYRQSLMVDVSPERLHRFFVQVEGGYQINQRVRERCVFAKHNLTSDPPFSSLDLISCRNVLIYFAPPLQKRVLPTFHYSLKPKSFLMLGTSESPGDSSDLFAVVDKKQKIYTRKSVPPRLNFDFVTRDYSIAATPGKPSNRDTEGLEVQQLADRIVLNHYAPVGVVINDELDVLQFRGETSPYLRLAPGEPSFNLSKIAHPGLLPELHITIHQAKQQDVWVKRSGLRVEGEQPREVKIEVIPFRVPPADQRYFLVLFEAVPASADPRSAEDSEQTDTDETSRLRQELASAKQDLADTQVYLQSILEEQQSTNQNFVAVNEEILSSNEELQSTNEELQTAKEEIQATNEELKTTNEELQSRNLEARQANDDLINLLNSVNIPIVILGGDLSIRRFTSTAQRILNLIPTDVGRPLNYIRHNLNTDLEAWVLEVMDTLNIKEQEVQDLEGHWYSLRIRPYRTTENQIDGAVLTLIDIDALKRSAEQLKASRDYAEAIVATVPEPLVVLDADLAVITANRSFYQTFHVSPTETEQQQIFELGNGQWNIPHLRSLLEEILPRRVEIQDFQVEHDFEQIGPKTMLLNAHQLVQANQEPMILLAIKDITERQQFEAERTQLLAQEQAARAEAEAANASKDEFISIISHELRTPLNAIQGWSTLLLRRQPDQATTTRALETIERNARLQLRLIEDLLDISRITQGKLRLEFRPVDLTPVIQDVLDTVQPAADEKRIQLQPSLAPGPVTISADSGRLQQVIWNLLANAIKFTPEGGRVEICLTCSPSQAQVQVVDTGQGISPEFLPYVFERFHQGDSTSTRLHQGLGLGLAIVRRLVELHGGTVEADSPGEGQGATFTVRLPLAQYSLKSDQNSEESDR